MSAKIHIPELSLKRMGAFFLHGVASGDPLSDAVVIWTRTESAMQVYWEMSETPAFEILIAAGSCNTEAQNDYTVNVDVKGLRPSTHYYYRFLAGTQQSPIGRTKTLPPSKGQYEIRFAQVSCAKFNAGFFNAYRGIAKRKDLDFLLHLGDYIYEASNTPPGNQTPGADIGRPFEPEHECKKLEDYRSRYKQYRKDPDVQTMHASLPIIAMVDDHEIADGAWRDGADEHDETRDGPWPLRVHAAFKARSEWMPIRVHFPADPTRFYRTVQIGDMADLFLLDTRTKRDKPVPPPEMYNEGRSALGVHQREWLLSGLASSVARWRVLANPSVLSATWSDSIDDQSRLAMSKLKLIATNGVDPDWDQWDGYPHERQELLLALEESKGNVIVLSGDIHASFVFELQANTTGPQGDVVGAEFVVPSITSQNFDDKMKWKPRTLSREYEEALLGLLPHAQWCELDGHGYNIVDINSGRVSVQYWHMQTVLEKTDQEFLVSEWEICDGESRVRRIDNCQESME